MAKADRSQTIEYKGQEWDVRDLLAHLIERVKELELNQCKPSFACTTRVDTMIDETFGD